jgi:transposase
MYLGSSERLVARLLSGEATSAISVNSYQHGDVAAFKALADRLGVAEMIDKHVSSSGQTKVSVGTTILLAAINRAIKPRSKRAWAEWAQQTSIGHLFGLTAKQLERLSSQHFWSCMDEIPISSLESIENELTVKVIQEFGIKLDLLFYDPTNFFTYIASDNGRSTLAQRGKNEQKRFDLRQVALSLLVSRDGQIPLASRTYAGNVPDCRSFPDSLTAIRQRLENLVGKLDAVTIVYDKGNNSRANQKQIDDMDFHYVASLVPSQQKDLMAVPSSEYKPLKSHSVTGVRTHRIKRELWGAERTLLLFTSESYRQKQIRGFEQHLGKAINQLREWQEQMEKPHGGPRSQATADKRIAEILSQQHLKDTLKVEYNPRLTGAKRLSFSIDYDALNHLYTEIFGKRLLMTSHHDWDDEEIIKAYNGQCKAEQTFAQLKNPEHLAVRPQYHRTDQKVRVHIFICLLGLMLTRLLERALREQHLYALSADELLDSLAKIRLAMLIERGKKGRPSCRWQLEDSDGGAMVLFKALVPNSAPFVYTL